MSRHPIESAAIFENGGSGLGRGPFHHSSARARSGRQSRGQRSNQDRNHRTGTPHPTAAELAEGDVPPGRLRLQRAPDSLVPQLVQRSRSGSGKSRSIYELLPDAGGRETGRRFRHDSDPCACSTRIDRAGRRDRRVRRKAVCVDGSGGTGAGQGGPQVQARVPGRYASAFASDQLLGRRADSQGGHRHNFQSGSSQLPLSARLQNPGNAQALSRRTRLGSVDRSGSALPVRSRSAGQYRSLGTLPRFRRGRQHLGHDRIRDPRFRSDSMGAQQRQRTSGGNLCDGNEQSQESKPLLP